MRKNGLERRYAATAISPDDRSAVLDKDVYYEIITALGVSISGELVYPLWEHVNFARLGHARALCDFFQNSKRKRSKNPKTVDDVVSADFGFRAKRLNLKVGELRRLNKDMFHLTLGLPRESGHQFRRL